MSDSILRTIISPPPPGFDEKQNRTALSPSHSPTLVWRHGRKRCFVPFGTKENVSCVRRSSRAFRSSSLNVFKNPDDVRVAPLHFTIIPPSPPVTRWANVVSGSVRNKITLTFEINRLLRSTLWLESFNRNYQDIYHKLSENCRFFFPRKIILLFMFL